MSDAPFEFSLSLAEIPVKIQRKPDEPAELCKLVELTGQQRDAYLTEMLGRMRYVDGKPQGMRDLTDFNARLIHLSLRDAGGVRIPVDEIRMWRATTQKALFKMAQELSGLNDDEAEKEKAKND